MNDKFEKKKDTEIELQTPEIVGAVGLNIEVSADSMKDQADALLLELDRERIITLERINIDALDSKVFALSSEDLGQIKEETGITAKLEVIKLKAKELVKKFKQAVLDRKVYTVFKQATPGGDNLHFGYTVVRNLISTLSTEELSRYPEFEVAANISIKESLKSMASQYQYSVHDYQIKDVEQVLIVFEKHPEILNKLLNDQEILKSKEEIFKNCLYSPGAQHSALGLSKSLRMDSIRTNELVVKAIKEDFAKRHENPNNHRYIYNVFDAITEFEIDKEVVQDLALDYFKSIATGTYSFSLDNSFGTNFKFSEKELGVFVEKNKEILELWVLQGAGEMLIKNHSAQVVIRIIEHFKKYFNLALDVERFKQLPENAQIVKKATLNSASEGTILYTQEDIQFVSSISVTDILRSNEGQEALYKGVQSSISKGKLVKAMQNYINKFDLNVATIRSNPETLQSLRGLLSNDIKNGSGVWREDLIKFLNIDEEKITDLKIKAITALTSKNEYRTLFRLMDSIQLSVEQGRNISEAIFGTGDKFEYLVMIKSLLETKFVPAACIIFIKEHERFIGKTIEQLQAYVTITQKISDSPSQEILKIKDQIIDQILTTEDPEKTYGLINNIFIQNNLPFVGKVARIFDALYPNKVLDKIINNNSSPILRQAKGKLRKNVIFQDLLKVHIESGNRSLKTFLTLLNEAEPLVERLQQNDLSEQKQKKLAYILRKLKTLTDVSLLGRQNEFPPIKGKSLLEDYDEIRSQLGVKAGQKISERVVDMFARPLGYKNIDEVLSEMQKSKKTADTRARKSIHNIRLQKGDLVKGVNIHYIDNILQNGSVAKEFLGASSSSDSTPLDTDVEVLSPDDKANFKESFESIQIATAYGDLVLVIKDRNQFQKTSNGEMNYDKTKYELFKTLKENHFGIRTGFPCTEVDFMVLNSTDPKETENLFYSIAQNGYYIPVVDKAGTVLLTPELFDQYRKVFSGVEIFEGENTQFTSLKQDTLYPDIISIMEAKEVDNMRSLRLKKEIRQLVLEVLGKYGIQLKGEFDDSLSGAELLDIGSTGRGTSAIGEGDFDLNLKLDANDFYMVHQISQEIVSKLGIEMKEAPITPSEGNNNQLRFFGSNIFSQKGLDIDIGFIKKSDINVYASHDAIADKLNNIRQTQGDEAYNEAVANILLAKKWLKEGGAYKKGNYGEGGLGGIGVENLILAYGANIKDAFGAFNNAAKNPDGSTKSFESFKQDFKILDAGMNLRFNNHDNFVFNMNEAGYRKMLEIISEHRL